MSYFRLQVTPTQVNAEYIPSFNQIGKNQNVNTILPIKASKFR